MESFFRKPWKKAKMPQNTCFGLYLKKTKANQQIRLGQQVSKPLKENIMLLKAQGSKTSLGDQE